MSAKGFQIIGIEAKRHKKSGPQKQVRIDHNTNIISARKINENDLVVEARYTVSYGILGIVQLDCEIIYQDNSKKQSKKLKKNGKKSINYQMISLNKFITECWDKVHSKF